VGGGHASFRGRKLLTLEQAAFTLRSWFAQKPRRRRILLGLAFAAALPAQVLAAPGDEPAWWSLTGENNNFVVDQDRHYVNGFSFNVLTSPLSVDKGWTHRSALAVGDSLPWLFPDEVDSDRRLEWTVLGQQIFTPANKNLSVPDAADRPYAGWLYTGLGLMQNTAGRRFDELSLTLGVVGPFAMGEEVQNTFHTIFSYGKTEGWSYQLHNEPAMTLSYVHKWRFGTRLDRVGGLEMDALPEAGITAGNVLTYGEATAAVRLGWGLDADYGPRMLQPALTGGGYFNPALSGHGWGGYLLAGVQGREVAHNIFLDGNTWENSAYVNRYPWVHDEYLGFSVFGASRFRADFIYVRRSREFDAQDFDDRYGSITVTVRL
jgi:lipid A 3-O-deacylase